MHRCDFCGELINEIARPKIEEPARTNGLVNIEAINVGWLDSIIQNSNECTLCRLVTRIWGRTGPKNETIDSNKHSDKNLHERVYVCFDNATPTHLTREGVRLYWLISVDFFYPGLQGRPSLPVEMSWQPRFTLLVDDVDKIGLGQKEVPYLLGRDRRHWVPYDIEFLKDCFDTCLTKHGQVCSDPVRTYNGKVFRLADNDELPLRMRCIDVAGQNVVYIPRDGSCQYAILSYVWGRSNSLLLLKENYAQLTTRDGLRNVHVPRTISDAMEVTIALGLRYLWVDALCIIQDYASEKYQVIQKMDKIYASAVLTIVAAGANHANHGLWTTTDGLRQLQIEEEVAGIRFIGTEPTLEQVLHDSIWKKRAWTYQEYVLSKRLLVFSQTQAYYSCESGSCAEDYVYTIAGDGRQEIFHPAGDDVAVIPVDRLLNFPIFWRSLLIEYTRRELSFESDGLNAAAGVMASYSVGSKDSFACGLPINDLFEYSILWYPSSSILRRRGALVNGERFPTWSWVGWVGPVTYEDLGDTMDFGPYRIVDCWCLKSVHKTLCYDYGELSINFNTVQRQSSNDPPTKQLLKEKADIDRHLSTMNSCTLCFTTAVARLQIAPSCEDQLSSSDDTRREHTGLYRILHRGKWIGSVHLEHHTAQQILQDHDQLHEFIALSVNSAGRWDVSPRNDVYSDSDVVGVFDEDLAEDFDEGHNVYNVMLVVYDVDVNDERSGAIATRAGIGQIHKQSFDLAGPTMKDLQLG